MINTIPEKQNHDRQLRRLAAQRQIYSTAKKVFLWQLIAICPVTILLAIIVEYLPVLKVYIAFWGVVLVIADLVWLTPWQNRLRERAAHIQELFDCDVLNLSFNELKARKRVDAELIEEEALKYDRWAHKMPPLANWYSRSVGELPVSLGRIACQRSNCWWDAQQRRRFTVSIIAFLCIVFCAFVILALNLRLTLPDFLLKIVVPFLPLFTVGWRHVKEQLESAERLDKLKIHSEGLWEQTLTGLTDDESERRSSLLQDEIFESRKRSPLFPDRIYKWFQGTQELQMNRSVDDLVVEASTRKHDK